MPGPSGGSQTVKLEFPSTTMHLRLARLVGAGVAADAGFGVDAVEELRIAVDEACAILVESAPEGSMLTLSFRLEDDAVVVEGRGSRQNGTGLDIHPIAAELLKVTTSEFSFSDPDETTRGFRLVKRNGRDAAS
jgi:serine/threonine-protein kinase RsbW